MEDFINYRKGCLTKEGKKYLASLIAKEDLDGRLLSNSEGIEKEEMLENASNKDLMDIQKSLNKLYGNKLSKLALENYW